jgi:hypothetical protein
MASREMPTERGQPAADPARLTVNPATNDLTLNPGDTLDEMISAKVPKGHKFKNVNLVASVTIALFVDSVDPPGGYGLISGKEEQTLVFRVRFHGISCREEPQLFTGTLDVVADGKVVAKKDIKITVPACPSEFVYSAKFICGQQKDDCCRSTPVVPGRYSTEINILNPHDKLAAVGKRVIPLVLAGAAAGREPKAAKPVSTEIIRLPALTATMDDCCRSGRMF